MGKDSLPRNKDHREPYLPSQQPTCVTNGRAEYEELGRRSRFNKVAAGPSELWVHMELCVADTPAYSYPAHGYGDSYSSGSLTLS